MTTSNPLIERIKIPGMSFRIPSLGVFYDKTILDSENGEVHVFPLMAIDELLIRNPDKILNGQAVEEIFSHCIPEVKNTKRLLAKDVDYLMLAIRRVSYGPTMDVTYAHTCENAKTHDYTFNIENAIQATTSLDPTSVASNQQITLENGQIVKVVPIRCDYNLEILQLANDMIGKKGKELEDIQKRLFGSTANIIESVDGITDQTQIREWLSRIPTSWYKQITKAIEDLSKWGTTASVKTQCQDCNEDIEINVPINPVNFFM